VRDPEEEEDWKLFGFEFDRFHIYIAGSGLVAIALLVGVFTWVRRHHRSREDENAMKFTENPMQHSEIWRRNNGCPRMNEVGVHSVV
jgi:hypothetical protein